MRSNLMIVARSEGDLYAYLKHDFADEPMVEVLLDRRHGERRRNDAAATTERRQGDRRTRAEVQAKLDALGFAFVHRA